MHGINTRKNLTDHQILVEHVIRKVFFKYLDITDKVRGAFKVTVYSLLMNYSYETVFAIGLKVYYWHKFQ